MKISIKTVIAIIVTTICLLLIIQVFSNSVVQTQCLNIEQSEVQQAISRIQQAVTNRYTQIGTEVLSWSQLNSTYEFMQNLNTNEYNATYLTVSSLDNLDINFVIFLNVEGDFVTGMGLNLTTLQPIPIPPDIITKVSSDSLIWNLGIAVNSPTSGFISTLQGPLMFASSPILMTNGAGPSQGVLVFGKYFNSGNEGTGVGASETEKISIVMGYQMFMEPIATFESQNSIQNGTLPASYIKPQNQQYITGYDIIDDIDGHPLFALGAMIPRTVYDQGLASISYIDEVLLSAGIVFSVIIVLFLEFSVLRRLGKLANSAVKLGKPENPSQELPVSGNDEITCLTLSINGFLQEIQSQNLKLQESEKLSAIGMLARQVGHDLRNPLASMKNAAYFLKRKGSKCTDEERDRMLEIIEEDIKRSDKIITDLVEYSSDIHLEVDECSPKSLVAGAMSKLKIPKYIAVVDSTLEEPMIRADVGRIQRVFASIITNAVEAMPKGGRLEILSGLAGPNVQVTFSDTGEGIPSDIMQKIFSPLLTTKAQGMGLSLAICKRIVDSHGGKIQAETCEEKGTTFKVILPIEPKIEQKDIHVQISKPDPLLHYKTNMKPKV